MNNSINVIMKYYTPLDVAAFGGLLCTGNEEIINKYNIQNFLYRHVIKSGHESLIEHINYNIYIEGVSRALLQELARHRHISMSVRSTRWAMKKMRNDSLVIPEDLDTEDRTKYKSLMNSLMDFALELRDKYSNDIAKFALPECLTTKLLLTINARELRHVFNLRSKPPALWEFNDLCECIYNEIPEDHKFLYNEYFK